MRARVLTARGAAARLALCFATGAPAAAAAHGPAPSALEVLSLRSDGSPGIVRTSVGLALPADPGRWSYGCPSAHGGVAAALAASTPDGGRVAALGGGRAYVSDDGGCSFAEVELAGRSARSVFGAAGRLWVVATAPLDAALLELLPSGAASVAALWSRDATGTNVFTPDSVAAPGGGDVLVVAGARRDAALLWAPLSTPGDALAFDPVAPLPATATSATPPEHLSLRTSAVSADYWVVVTVAGEQSLWAVADGSVRETGITAEVILGPVRADDRWLAAADGEWLQIALDGSAAPLGSTSAACLDEVGGGLFACQIDRLMRLSAAGADVAATAVFAMDQLDPPDASCVPDGVDGELCRAEWLHFGVEAGAIDLAGDAGVAGSPGDVGTAPAPRSGSGCCGAPAGGAPRWWQATVALLLTVRLRPPRVRRRPAACGRPAEHRR
ncbi:MAG: hypothetical protein H6698_06990 [Myxococcales bacterium]|nr:hypothetical protein [Myxococcales bacterium]MCB9531435.1 hypothetical protein [Myxococcales bacterium]MCB9534054.1 hypothetical protein [Myxococcales bacterium]